MSSNTPNQDYKKAYFASGCFWCVEAIYQSIDGVIEVTSGYSGSTWENPTYEEVSSGKTGHAETVEVTYDPKKVSFLDLVEVFFGSHDPTTFNRQGPDSGSQYRSVAFYQNLGEKKEIEGYIRKIEHDKVFKGKIVTDVLPFKKFWKAEEYHQDYEKRNPNNSYIKAISIPRLDLFQSRHPKFLKKK